MEQALVNWLLDSDPALRWQVERDLLDAPVELWGSTHARVSHEGFGAKLLALQDEDGQNSCIATESAPRARKL